MGGWLRRWWDKMARPGPAPLACRCCGKLESIGDILRGWTCGCPMLEWCRDCYHCARHCPCPEGPLYRGGSDALEARFRRRRRAQIAE